MFQVNELKKRQQFYLEIPKSQFQNYRFNTSLRATLLLRARLKNSMA